MPKTPYRPDRLLELAAHLETKVPKAAFDLRTWGMETSRHPCGFAGCAMGWAGHDGLFGLRFDDGEVIAESGKMGFTAAEEVFGIERHIAFSLFHAEFYSKAEADKPHNPTTCEVAAKIRRYVKAHPTPVDTV